MYSSIVEKTHQGRHHEISEHLRQKKKKTHKLLERKGKRSRAKDLDSERLQISQ